MITQKERKLLIMLLIFILVGALILSISIISFVAKTEEIPEETEPVAEVRAVAETEPIQTEPTEIIETTVETTVATEPEETIETEPVATETICEETYVEETTEIDKEFEDRCRLTYAEARGECIEGQIAVTATIINREESAGFPNTFHGVMNDECQFSPVWNGEVHVNRGGYYSVLCYEEVSEQTIDAVQRALDGEDPTEQLLWEEAERLGLDPVKYAEGGALYFYNPAGCDWQQQVYRANIKVKVQIGNHIFYKVWDV